MERPEKAPLPLPLLMMANRAGQEALKENFNRGMIEDTKEEERYLKRWLHQDIDGDCSAKTPLTLPPQKRKETKKQIKN